MMLTNPIWLKDSHVTREEIAKDAEKIRQIRMHT
jgi:hypothetical protein